ncbi:unnamed protein product, partial [Hymenolepis diminuta]
EDALEVVVVATAPPSPSPDPDPPSPSPDPDPPPLPPDPSPPGLPSPAGGLTLPSDPPPFSSLGDEFGSPSAIVLLATTLPIAQHIASANKILRFFISTLRLMFSAFRSFLLYLPLQ